MDTRRRSSPRLTLRSIVLIVTVTFLATLAVRGAIDGYWGGGGLPSARKVCADEPLPSGIHQVDYLYLSIFTNAQTGIDFYQPANFTVPSHTLVHFTIENHDNGSSTVASEYGQVCGTVNDTMDWGNVTTSQVDPADVSHTLTITDGPYVGFNIPVPPAPRSGSHSTVVTFTAFFNDTGTFHWKCEANCGETQMGVDGKMSGLFTVI